MKRTLIKCGWLVSGDPAIGDMREAELLYSGNRIEAVGRNLGAAADEVIDAGDKIVMPGLVNAHMHTWQTGIRGIGAEWMTPGYMQNVHGNLDTRNQPEDNYLGDLIGALAQIDGGVRKKDGRLTFPDDVMGARLDQLAESAARIVREGDFHMRALN